MSTPEQTPGNAPSSRSSEVTRLPDDIASRVALNSLRFSAAGRRLQCEETPEPEPTPTYPGPPVPPTMAQREADRRRALRVQSRTQAPPAPNGIRPESRQEHRLLDKFSRRHRRSFMQAAEKLRVASANGAAPGTRTPFFESPATVGTTPRQSGLDADGNPSGRSSQELARPDRYTRTSDIGTPDLRARVDGPNYTKQQRKSELRADRIWRASDAWQRQILESNNATVEDTDTLGTKARRFGHRIGWMIARRGRPLD